MTAQEAAPSAGAASETRFVHVAMAVHALDTALGWYERIFGFALRRRLRFEGLGADVAFLAGPGFEIEMFAFDEGLAAEHDRSNPVADLKRGGISHFALEVRDLVSEVARLEGLGVVITVPPMRSETGDMIAFIQDLEGNVIELIDRTD